MIDTIKTRVEASCNATVSCADILALAAREGVVLVSINIVLFLCLNKICFIVKFYKGLSGASRNFFQGIS